MTNKTALITVVFPLLGVQKGDEHAQEGQTCLGCNATSTPEWRRGPLGKHSGHLIPGCMCVDSVNKGPRTLCNACGLVYAKLVRHRGSSHELLALSDVYFPIS